MRKVLVTILALALTIGAKGQTETIDTAQFVAVYDYECRTQDAEGTPVTDRMQVVVQVGRTVTKSMPLSAYKEMDMEEEDDIMAAHQEAYLHMPTVWTGYPNGQTTVRDWIFPHEFEGTEPTPKIAWTLTDDTLTIGGYYCQTATCKFRGVAWTVCYTEEIPSSAGPWRLRGLPGLIVEAKNEAHTFCLTELRQEHTPIAAPEKNPDVQRMAYAKLLKHRNDVYGNRQYAKNPFFHVPDLNGGNLSLGGSIRHMEVFEFGGQQLAFADGHPLLTKAHVYQPLELK
ncbi:MAG: GLPGLI family protein [Bacteroidaceae bacterium]|nr:GLPGLI family protein [Bacteroidaceae bacterium]